MVLYNQMFTTLLLSVIIFSIVFIILSVFNLWPIPLSYSICIAVFIDVTTILQFLVYKYSKHKNQKSLTDMISQRD